MSNGQQAKSNSARPVRPGGVLVNFPATRDHLPESPVHSSEVQSDDQSFSTPSRTTGREPEPVTVQRLVPRDDEWSADPDPGFSQGTTDAGDEEPESLQADETLVQPVEPIHPKRSWLERWLFPDTSGQDKRSVARKPAPGLVAHFWTGGPPKPQPVRDISATGMYVVTDERWYLGTQVRITLTKTLEDGPRAGSSITVMATAVRWGNDGVGLEFVQGAAGKTRRHEQLSEGADGEQLGQFVEQFGATSASGQRKRGASKR